MRFTALLCTLLVSATFSSAAHADYFYWQDPKTGVKITFPDTWRMINNQKPDDLLTILGPSAADRPVCRLRAHEDKRYTTYPVWFSESVQRAGYGQEFWDRYTAEYDNVTQIAFKNGAQLGKAFASMAVINYTSATPKDDTLLRTASLFAGVYYDTAYVLDCSARAGAYREWNVDFMSIAKSVDMRKVIAELPNGYYRDFTRDKYLTHPVMNGPDHMGQTYN